MGIGKRKLLVVLISIIIVMRIGGYVFDRWDKTKNVNIQGKVYEEIKTENKDKIKIDSEHTGDTKGDKKQEGERNTEEKTIENDVTEKEDNGKQNIVEEEDGDNKGADGDNRDIDENNRGTYEGDKDEQNIDNNVVDECSKQVYGESFINYSDIENIEGEFILVATFISCQICKDMKKEVIEYMETGGKRKIYNIDIRDTENRDYIINTGAKIIPTTLIIEDGKVKKIKEGVINSGEFDNL